MKVDIIVDLQFGSCGKGLLAGYLAEVNDPDTLVTAWAPNAGHTYIDAAGRKFVNVAIPNGIVSKKLKRILLGPGSVINPLQLTMELENYGDLIDLSCVDLMIHENAAIVTEAHRLEEAQGMVGIGSTMKGVGAATIQKIKRNSSNMNTAREMLAGTPLEGYVVSGEMYNDAVDRAEVMQVEGAQGFSLGINSGFYPYTTSRECTVAQLLSDCGLPITLLSKDTVVWGAARTFPIRVANRHDADGNQIGWSGPCYPDQYEMDWADLNMEPELTTVTKLPRRIFTFSKQQISDAERMNGIDKLFLNFVNYLTPEQEDALLDDILISTGLYPSLIGRGPTVMDVEVMDSDVPNYAKGI